MIQFQDVGLTYGKRVLFKGIDFNAGFGEKIAILGGSGEGKTTILRLMLGLVFPDHGRILINGEDIARLPEASLGPIRLNFNIVFQQGALFDSMNIKENVAFGLREHHNLPESEIDQRVRGLLQKVGIEDAIYMMPDELSGGMQRRAAIARSLAMTETRMLLYDEPTTGLDPISAENICRLISSLSQGPPGERRGLVVVTHQVVDAVFLAERFIFIADGQIAFDGDLENLKRDPHPRLRAFIKPLLLEEECKDLKERFASHG